MSSLCERFESFIKTLDGFENIDALLQGFDLRGKKRADYLVRNRAFIIEQKLLEKNPVERPQKFVERLGRKRGFVFMGTLSTDYIFKRQPDPEVLQQRMILDLARVIDDDVAYADKQTSDTRNLFNVPDAIGILAILNESAGLLRPDVIDYALRVSFQKKTESGAPRYPANDGVIVISEASAIAVPGFQQAFPIQLYVSPQRRRAAEVEQFMEILMKQWAAFNSLPLVTMQIGSSLKRP